MHIPRFILAAFIALVVGGTLLATGLLVSNSEPQLGDSVIVTPSGTRPPTPAPSPTASPEPTSPPPTVSTSPVAPPPTQDPVIPPPPPEGAQQVPGCAPLVDDDDCDDWDDVDDD